MNFENNQNSLRIFETGEQRGGATEEEFRPPNPDRNHRQRENATNPKQQREICGELFGELFGGLFGELFGELFGKEPRQLFREPRRIFRRALLT